jgi:hypothetical protein
VGGYTKRDRLVAERCFNRIYDKGSVFISLMLNSHRVVHRAGSADIGKVEDTARGLAEQGLRLLPGRPRPRGGRQATLLPLQAQEDKYGFSLTDTTA